MKVVDAIAKFLEEKGVEKVFSVTGGASALINDAFLRNGNLELVYAHNESSCSFMAEGYFRISGKPAVCLVTVGPGATNLITGVYGCWTDSIPTLVISGQSFLDQTVGSSELRQLGTQEAAIIPIVKNFTKSAFTLERPEEVFEVLEKSWLAMVEPRKGPTWLEIPADIQNRDVTVQSIENKPLKEVTFSKDTVAFCEEYLRVLMKSRFPVLHVGGGVRNSDSKDSILKVISKLGIPVLLTHSSYDLLATTDPSNFGFPGIFGHRYANLIIQQSDCYLALGTRLTLAQTGYRKKTFAPKAVTFMVDIDEPELKKEHLRIDFSLAKDVAEVARCLDYLISSKQSNYEMQKFELWHKACDVLRSKFDINNEHSNFTNSGVSPYNLIREVSKFLTPSDTVVTDMGTSYQSTYQAIRIPKGCKLLTNTGFASMGWGLPAAIGAWHYKNNRVICITGDGGLMMSLQELASVPQEADISIWLYNNEGYLTQLQTQLSTFGRKTGVDRESGLRFPNYAELARSFGLFYIEITKNNFNSHEIKNIMQDSRPRLINVLMSLSQEQAPKLVNKKLEDGSTRQSELDDMWPFLPKSAEEIWQDVFKELGKT